MLILASASPRRQELLRSAGISFAVDPADIDETPASAESAQALAQRLAHKKTVTVFARHPRDFVLGADTVVVIDGVVLGKPRDGNDATRMLKMLSGRSHSVITGVCLASPLCDFQAASLSPVNAERSSRSDAAHLMPTLRTLSETTLVTMTEIPDNEMQAYIARGEPMDKAGGYGIQGMAARWIPRIEGDYSNVVGLPLARVYRMLQECGAI